MEQSAEAATVYHAPALPAPARADARRLLEKKLRRTGEGLDMADKRLKLASVVLQGGFPEDVMRPLRLARRLVILKYVVGRALTAPPVDAEGEGAPPPSVQAVEGFIATIQELIDLGREWVAKEGL
jgi:hypothetical protein